MWGRLWRFFSSLKLAVILLIAITVVSLLGTLFPQLTPEVVHDHQASASWLAMARDKYGTLARVYETLGLFDVYRSPGFALLIIALILNTLVCTIRRFKATWQAIRARPKVVMPDMFYERVACRASLALAQEAEAADAARWALARRRYRVLVEEQAGATYLYADRNRWARVGTLITHLGVVLIVLGFVWSQGWGWREPAVALGPGELYQVGRGNDFQVRNDGFEVERYPGGLPKDYRARLTVLQGNSQVISKTVRVNDPLSYQGVGFYLSSYGPAARVRAYDALGNPLSLQVIGGKASKGEVVLNFAGEGEGLGVGVPSLDLALHVVFYYEGPSLFVQATRSDQAVFADFVYDGETVELGEAKFGFTLDRYVVVQVVSDPGFKLVIAAAFLVVVGLILSLYFPHRRIWANVTRDEIRLAGLTAADKVGFERELAAIVEGIERNLKFKVQNPKFNES
jgi:cytochrome c biogenesis protein